MNKTTEALKLAEGALAINQQHIDLHTPEYVVTRKINKEAIAAIREALADHSGDANEMVYSKPSVFDGVCCGCSKKAADGWALYCVECWEKSNGDPFADAGKPITKPVKQETPYCKSVPMCAKPCGDESCVEPVKQEPVLMPVRRGSRITCVESGEKCVVWATSHTDCWVQFPDGHSGQYTYEQIGSLFSLDEQAEQEPVAWTDAQISRAFKNSPELHKDVTSFTAFKRVVKAIEAMHGCQPPVDAKAIGLAIHYPDCWDTAAYPTLDSALAEIAAWGKAFRCTNDDCVDAKAIRAESCQQGRNDMKEEAAKWFEGYDNQAWFELTQEEAAAAIRGLK